jgi:hypothetical protein
MSKACIQRNAGSERRPPEACCGSAYAERHAMVPPADGQARLRGVADGASRLTPQPAYNLDVEHDRLAETLKTVRTPELCRGRLLRLHHSGMAF